MIPRTTAGVTWGGSNCYFAAEPTAAAVDMYFSAGAEMLREQPGGRVEQEADVLEEDDEPTSDVNEEGPDAAHPMDVGELPSPPESAEFVREPFFAKFRERNRELRTPIETPRWFSGDRAGAENQSAPCATRMG